MVQGPPDKPAHRKEEAAIAAQAGASDRRSSNASVEGPSDTRRPKHVSRLDWRIRTICLLSGLFAASLLITARVLTPSPTGVGTHQQLGLPPCTSIILFNARCPACGMTTSWALFMRCEFAQAFHVNAGGALLALTALAFLPASCYFFVSGKGTRKERFSLALGSTLLLAMLIAVVQWWWRS